MEQMTLEQVLQQTKIQNEHLGVFLIKNGERKQQLTQMQERMQTLFEDLEQHDKDLDLHLRAIKLMGSASDNTIDQTLEQITSVINKSLSIIFPTDRRVIHISKFMYRDEYLHYEVELETGVGVKRDFTMSGTGLAQVVSFLFVVSFIDVIKARRFLVMDEILNGLHPEAKEVIREIMLALSSRFQFLIAEHHMDIGKQYMTEKLGDKSVYTPYQGQEGYYTDFYKNGVKHFLKYIDDVTDQESESY